jgi:hypothetical protein
VWSQYTQSCQSQIQNPNGPNIIGQNQTIGPLIPGTIPCPAAYPFFNGATCFNCYDPTPIFNASTLQCTACTGGIYSPTDYRCYNYNGTNPIYNATIINPQLYPPPNTAFCRQQTPYFNGMTCISCNGITPYFDQLQYTCVQCPSGTFLNPNTHTCQASYPNASNPSAANSSIGPIYTAGPNDIPCPPATPFFVGGSCINCYAPTPNFNSTSQSCASCPVGTAYNAPSQSCILTAVSYTNNLNATNWVSSTPFADFVSNGNAVASGVYAPCPIDNPYYNGFQCINCPAGQYFNVTTGQCVYCPFATTFDQLAKKCLPNNPPYLTNPNTSPNLLFDNYPQNLWRTWYTGNQTA